MTYKQAMAYPAKHGGWAHIAKDSESMQACTADAMGRNLCIRSAAIYDWAIRQNVSLRDSAKLFIDTPDLLLCCVLNDWTVEHTLSQLEVKP